MIIKIIAQNIEAHIITVLTTKLRSREVMSVKRSVHFWHMNAI